MWSRARCGVTETVFPNGLSEKIFLKKNFGVETCIKERRKSFREKYQAVGFVRLWGETILDIFEEGLRGPVWTKQREQEVTDNKVGGWGRGQISCDLVGHKKEFEFYSMCVGKPLKDLNREWLQLNM